MDKKIGLLYPDDPNHISDKWHVIVGFDYSRGHYLSRCAYTNYGIRNPIDLVGENVHLYTMEEAISIINNQIQKMSWFQNLLEAHRPLCNAREETEFNRLLHSYVETKRLADSFQHSTSSDAMHARRGLRAVKKRMFNYYGDYALDVMLDLQRHHNEYSFSTYGSLLQSIAQKKKQYLGSIMYIQGINDDINNNVSI